MGMRGSACVRPCLSGLLRTAIPPASSLKLRLIPQDLASQIKITIKYGGKKRQRIKHTKQAQQLREPGR